MKLVNFEMKTTGNFKGEFVATVNASDLNEYHRTIMKLDGSNEYVKMYGRFTVDYSENPNWPFSNITFACLEGSSCFIPVSDVDYSLDMLRKTIDIHLI